jgi:G2/mitotic-specific cyclin 2
MMTTATTATTRPKTALLNTVTVSGKRKRDALVDATNGKAKATVAINSKIASLGAGSTKTSAASQRASSVSTNTSTTTKENATIAGTATARTRAPLGAKSKNVPSASAASTVSEKQKRTEITSKEVVTRRPLASKTARPVVVAKDVTVSKTRKFTHTTVHQETKTQQVILKAHGERVATITKVEDVEVEEVDEDELRSHKRPRLSDEVEEQLVEAKDFGSITVEEVKEVLTTRLIKPEDEQPDDLDKDDVDDPLMVAEYVVEIFDYLHMLEVCPLLVAIDGF